MKTCSKCGLLLDESRFRRGQSPCRACENEKARAYRQTEAYRIVKERYRQSEKGKQTARAREERPDIKEKRRLFSRSPQGKVNQAKYEATEKGQATRVKALTKYRASPQGKLQAQAMHERRKLRPEWKEKKKAIDQRWRQSEKGRASRAAMSERRRARKACSPEIRLTAAQWLEILKVNRYRCFYCKQKMKLTMDHVIPLSKGGMHVRENVVPACQGCNSQKNDRLTMLL